MTNEMTPTYERMIKLGQLPPDNWKGELAKLHREIDRQKKRADELEADYIKLRNENLRFQTLLHVGEKISAEEVAKGYFGAIKQAEKAEENEEAARYLATGYLIQLHKAEAKLKEVANELHKIINKERKGVTFENRDMKESIIKLAKRLRDTP